MVGGERKLDGDVRGISNVVGYILLLGMVMTGVVFTVGVASETTADLRAEAESDATALSYDDLDSKLGSLSVDQGTANTSFSLPRADERQMAVEDDAGRFTVEIQGKEDCSTQISFDSIRSTRSNNILAYEAGGVWKRPDGGGSVMVSRPDVRWNLGSLHIESSRFDGTIDEDNVATLDVVDTRADSQAHESALHECSDIQTIKLTIESDFQQAWANYLEDELPETGASVSTSGDRTVTAEISGALPERVQYDKNNVVNFALGSSGYMAPGPNGASGTPPSITIDKGESNEYDVAVRPLSQRPPSVGDVMEVDPGKITNIERGPVDVVLVFDESGSMSGSKRADAVDAGQGAVQVFKDASLGDSVAIVGFDDYGRIRQTNSQHFSSDYDTVQDDTMEDIGASGGTQIHKGLNRSVALLNSRDNDRPKFILLMTDGVNNPNTWSNPANRYTRNGAAVAKNRGYEIHTFAFGSDADEGLMKEVATDPDSKYYHYSADGDELEDDFAEVARNIGTKSKYMVRPSLSTSVSGSGTTYPPSILGDTSNLESHTVGGTTYLNVNDPSAPALFSHSFSVEDGDSVSIDANYAPPEACTGWDRTSQTESHGGKTYTVVRCTDIDESQIQQLSSMSGPDTGITVFENESDVSSIIDGPNDDETKDTLDPYLEDLDGDSDEDELSIKSNQLVVVLDFPDGDTTNKPNRMVLLYEIGKAESDVTGSSTVTIQDNDVIISG